MAAAISIASFEQRREVAVQQDAAGSVVPSSTGEKKVATGLCRVGGVLTQANTVAAITAMEMKIAFAEEAVRSESNLAQTAPTVSFQLHTELHDLEPEDDPHVSTFKNTLLRSLDPEIIRRLSLRPVTFEVVHEIEFPGKTIDHLFFVEEGIASMTTTFKDGSQVEVGMFGYESVIGVSALMGTKRSLNRVYTQIEGRGFSCKVEAAREEFSRCGEFQKLTLRYVQAQLLQAMQTAGCNAKHHMEERLARWLLICADRAHTEELKLSHEFLADMLGSTRPTVSIAAGALKNEGLIDYNRGVIHILDTKRLEQRACECYRVIKDHLDNYTEFDTGNTA